MSDIFKKIGETITETGKSIGETLSGTSKTVSEKTKQVSNAAKLNGRIVAAEHSISENYSILGKYYYDTFKDAPAEEVAETVYAITASFDSIDEMKEQLLTIKGLVKCKACGAECPMEDDFCGKCGAKLEKPEPPVEEPAEEESEEIEIVVVEDEAPAEDSAEE